MAARSSVCGAELQRVQCRIRYLLVGVGQGNPTSGLSGGQLVLEDVCSLLLVPRVVDPLAPEEHGMLFHPRVGRFAGSAGQPTEAVEVLIRAGRSV